MTLHPGDVINDDLSRQYWMVRVLCDTFRGWYIKL
jgi:hypothetical protein